MSDADLTDSMVVNTSPFFISTPPSLSSTKTISPRWV